MFKKAIVIGSAFLLIASGHVFACDGPNCSGSGNFDIEASTAAGGVSGDIQTIPNGVAGGIGAAGGIAGGEADGAYETGTIKIFGKKKTFSLGDADADINLHSGGVTKTDAYTFTPSGIEGPAIGVGSATDNFATVGGSLEGGALGLAYSKGEIGGIAGQTSLDSSMVGPSPFFGWDSEGSSYGVAGQGSIGGFEGDGGAFGLGSYKLEADIDMWGQSYSNSYRGIVFDGPSKTEIMGSNVGASTQIDSMKYDHDCGLADADVDGGYVAGGHVFSDTTQKVDGGQATAFMNGGYSGTGELGCSFNGSVNGYTQTSMTTINGYNGSIAQAAAGAHASSMPSMP